MVEDCGRALQREFQRPVHEFARHSALPPLLDLPLGCAFPGIDDYDSGRGNDFDHQDMGQDSIPDSGPLPGKGCELLGHGSIRGHKPDICGQWGNH